MTRLRLQLYTHKLVRYKSDGKDERERDQANPVTMLSHSNPGEILGQRQSLLRLSATSHYGSC